MSSSAAERLGALKREAVPLLGGAFCVGKGTIDCQDCEYEFPSSDVVFHNASYEYPNDGDYRCIDCFISWATAAPITRSMEEQMEKDMAEKERALG